MRLYQLLNETNETQGHDLFKNWKYLFDSYNEFESQSDYQKFFNLYNNINSVTDENKLIFVFGLDNQQTYRLNILGDAGLANYSNISGYDRRLRMISHVSSSMATIILKVLIKHKEDDGISDYTMSIALNALNGVDRYYKFTGRYDQRGTLETVRGEKVVFDAKDLLSILDTIASKYRGDRLNTSVFSFIDEYSKRYSSIPSNVLSRAGQLSSKVRKKFGKKAKISSKFEEENVQLELIKKNTLENIKFLIREGIFISERVKAAAIKLDPSVRDILDLAKLGLDPDWSEGEEDA